MAGDLPTLGAESPTPPCDCYPGGWTAATFEGPQRWCAVHGEGAPEDAVSRSTLCPRCGQPWCPMSDRVAEPVASGDLPEVPQQPQRRNPMNPRDGLQDRGEPHRRRLGIDGTAADAQDVDHPYLADAPRGDWCVICGLSRSFRRHVDVGGS